MTNIVRLPDSTIQMIAAGEVITRPVNVVKEMIENSLDAGATNIRITIEQGGVKLIEIIDNGHGIARANAGLLCRRYTTSKLSTADDLTKISTFGFRGEALASISEMADLEVKSFNIESDKTGWQAKYMRGELVAQLTDRYLQHPGTQLRVTNLFAAICQRKSAMQTGFVEEKKLIIELVKRYAIHHRDRVTMCLKEGNSPDLICVLAPMDIKPCIGYFFGHEMEKSLLEFDADNEHNYKAQAHVVFSYKRSTGVHHNTTLILFVNNRLVECPELKREAEALLHEYLNSKQYISLLYIALKVPPFDVDVNTHPAKATVALHYQVEIIALIISTLKSKLSATLANHSIPFSHSQKSVNHLIMKSSSSSQPLAPVTRSQSKPSTPVPLVNERRLRLLAPASNPITPVKRPHELVHNDSTQLKLEQLSTQVKLEPHPEERISPKRQRRDLNLRSINDLKQLVAKEKSRDTAKTIKNSVFVGIFDHDRALVQHETKLYAINLRAYLKEQYYQFYLFDFGNFPPIEILPPGNKIEFIIDTYLEDIRKHEASNFQKLIFNTSKSVIDELLKHSTMFDDYLTLKITKDEILTLPCIMPDEIPNLLFLGRFLVKLVNNVDHTDERKCLQEIGRLFAEFYSEPPANLKDRDVHRRYHDLVETKLYVAIKNYLLIPEWLFTRENICQISDTKDLYKVFERC